MSDFSAAARDVALGTSERPHIGHHRLHPQAVMAPEAGLVVCRFAIDASLMLLWGAFGYIWALMPPGLATEIDNGLVLFRRTAAAVAVIATLALLPTEIATIGDGWAAAIEPATIRAVLFDTNVGWVWMMRAAASLLLAAVTVSRPPLAGKATAVVSALLLAMLALGGHAAMQEGILGAFHRFNDAVHVLSGGAWFGALVPLLLVMQALARPDRRHDASVALRRFSNAGHGAVAVVLASGSLNTVLVLGRWPTDWSSPYQRLLAIKIAAVSIMTLLALVNRYVLVPHLARGNEADRRALRFGTIAEIALGLGAIACVSVFGILDPT